MALSLAEMAVQVLTTADGREKTALSRRHAATWFAARESGQMLAIGNAVPPLMGRALGSLAQSVLAVLDREYDVEASRPVKGRKVPPLQLLLPA